MWKLRMCVFAVGGLCSLGTGTAALAASGTDATAGEVWLDNVGQPAATSRGTDPHLACADINLWGSGLAHASGTFSITGWALSGSQDVDYSGTWTYSPTSGGRVVAVINARQLLEQAHAAGDQPSVQGYHFKLGFSGDSLKQKTFWLSCGSSAPGGGAGSGDGGSNDGGSSSGLITAPAGSTGIPLAVKTAMSATHTTRHRHRRHKRILAARHHRPHKPSLRRARRRLPTFTG